MCAGCCAHAVQGSSSTRPQSAADIRQQKSDQTPLQNYAACGSTVGTGGAAASQQSQLAAVPGVRHEGSAASHAGGQEVQRRPADPSGAETLRREHARSKAIAGDIRPAESGDLDARERGLHAGRFEVERASSWPAAALKCVPRVIV